MKLILIMSLFCVQNTKCPLSAFPTFLLQLIKMVIPHRYSAIVFRYPVITCLSLVAGEEVLFEAKIMCFLCIFLAKMFGNIRNILYLCNVIEVLITSGI